MSSKSVRFASSVASHNAKRPRNDDGKADSFESSKRYRPNEDKDDGDDGQEQQESDLEQTIPSERQLLEAKRRRRRQRNSEVNAEGNTEIDESTSLATDGIQIEPFHMKREESDGTGFFDGDTYVWRKHDPNDEPDAWLDSLDDTTKVASSTVMISKSVIDAKGSDEAESRDKLTVKQLYKKLLPLMSGNETVAQAVRRYGRVSSQSKLKSQGGNQRSAEAHNASKSCLDDLTGSANALLLKGEVNIYDATRQWILENISVQEDVKVVPDKKETPADWEYKGNQDGKIHGPYTTEQMMNWMQAGYFIGLQKVRIRTIRKKTISMEDDLMSDLMDDDEKLDANTDTEKGEWQWSDEVNMHSYLP